MGAGGRLGERARTIRDRQEAGCGELFISWKVDLPKWLPGEHLVEQQ